MSRLGILYPNFEFLNDEEKLCFILCPPNTEISKCVSKFLGIMTNVRKEIDAGLSPEDLKRYIKHKATAI